MSHGKTSEDLHTSVGELANLMNDTFTYCIRNYEALLPYLEKKETKPKIYHKLVHINILLSKLNEELVGLRVEYVTVSSYDEEEVILSEGRRKRRMSDVFEVGRQETKNIKTEPKFSGSTKLFIASASDTRINMQPENLVSAGSKKTRYTEPQKSEMRGAINIKTEIQDSNEAEDSLADPIDNGEISTLQTTCDSISGDKESVSEAVIVVGGNAYDKTADTVTQSKNNEGCAPLQMIDSESSIQEKSEDDGHIPSKDDIYGAQEVVNCSSSYPTKRALYRKESTVDFTACNSESDLLLQGRSNIGKKAKKNTQDFSIRHDKDHLPVHSAKGERYGIISHKNGGYMCTLCDCELPGRRTVKGHVKGKKHKRKQKTAKNGCAQKSEVTNNSSKSIAPISTCPDISCSVTDTVLGNMGESPASISVGSAVSCSLVDTLVIVEGKHQVISMKHAIRLDDLWKYFDATFHINKKFFRIHSGQVMCYLCNKHVGTNVLCVKKHISGSCHLRRIRILRGIELKYKSSNNQLLDIPGILEKIIPMTEFYLKNKGFFCSVCDCFCENEVVLSHMTSFDHCNKCRQNGLRSGVLR